MDGGKKVVTDYVLIIRDSRRICWVVQSIFNRDTCITPFRKSLIKHLDMTFDHVINIEYIYSKVKCSSNQ